VDDVVSAQLALSLYVICIPKRRERNSLHRLRPNFVQRRQSASKLHTGAKFAIYDRLVVGCDAHTQFLEEAAIWSRVVRLAGSGTGALVATLLTLGYTAQQLEQLLNFDIRKFTRGTLSVAIYGRRRRYSIRRMWIRIP